ncbi:hypothetical protein ANN_12908 [Periplaneta americana]|uniref:RNase H type-1 domain-containing protein n=1 Tax=Periplaneta americana TaxID=6978 RepID=A0ABQ8THW5_PERAM|nr:hypothetical protein ANN_12908 [Periplaneta americana]
MLILKFAPPQGFQCPCAPLQPRESFKYSVTAAVVGSSEQAPTFRLLSRSRNIPCATRYCEPATAGQVSSSESEHCYFGTGGSDLLFIFATVPRESEHTLCHAVLRARNSWQVSSSESEHCYFGTGGSDLLFIFATVPRPEQAVLDHPSYGSDLAPCDFGLFPEVKMKLKGRHFTSDVELLVADQECGNLPKEKWQNWFSKWFRHSKAVILSIVSKHTPSSQTAEITKMLSQLISLNKRIVFQWIPSHCGILGNENADALAKKGSTTTYRPVAKSTYYSVKRFIKSTYLDFNKQNLITQSQENKCNSLHQNPQLIPDLPRKSSVAAFRLATGHDCLAKHLHRIGIYQSPNCPLCNSNQEMDSEHLKICASVEDHDNIFEKYWSARGQMTLLSNAWH